MKKNTVTAPSLKDALTFDDAGPLKALDELVESENLVFWKVPAGVVEVDGVVHPGATAEIDIRPELEAAKRAASELLLAAADDSTLQHLESVARASRINSLGIALLVRLAQKRSAQIEGSKGGVKGGGAAKRAQSDAWKQKLRGWCEDRLHEYDTLTALKDAACKAGVVPVTRDKIDEYVATFAKEWRTKGLWKGR
jgi:hypothetical protein